MENQQQRNSQIVYNLNDVKTVFPSSYSYKPKDINVPTPKGTDSVRLLELNHIHAKHAQMRTMWGWSIPFSSTLRDPTTVIKVLIIYSNSQ